nr:hypothetical protein CFP56_44791 [Quercus suber]
MRDVIPEGTSKDQPPTSPDVGEEIVGEFEQAPNPVDGATKEPTKVVEEGVIPSREPAKVVPKLFSKVKLQI